jgi:hypothetical protein
VIWKKILISLGLTVGVSLVCSLFLLNFGFNFLYSFLFFILLQFIGFFFYGEYIRLRDNKLSVLAEIKALEEISKVTTVVTCPCDRALTASVPLSLHKKNEYVCAGCDKKISVIVETKTALATEPMNFTRLDDPAFIQEVEKLAEDSNNRL